MAKTITIHFVCDADYLSIYPNLSEEDYQRFQEDPDCFEDERVSFVEYVNFRTAEFEDEEGDYVELDEDIYDNTIQAEGIIEDAYDDNGEIDPEKKELYELGKALESRINGSYSSIDKLKPNSVTILGRWHTYKEMDDYELELEDEEEFDVEKLQFVIDDYYPEWKMANGEYCLPEIIWDFFVEDRISVGELLYDNKLLDFVNSEDLGAYLVKQCAIRTDSEGNVVSIEKLK